MAPIKRKRITNGILSVVSGSRRGSVSSAGTKRRRMSNAPGPRYRKKRYPRGMIGATERTARVTKGKGRVRVKGRKKVVVSKKLRAKISSVIDSRKIHGYFQDNRVDLCDPGLLPGQQNVERLPNRTFTFAGYLFNYDRVLHAASRLWNGKGAVQNPNVADALNFAPTDTTIIVNKQWWTFRCRNNSVRTQTIRVIKCQSKNSVQATDAQFAWSGSINQQIADLSLIGAPTINTLHTNPTMYTQFRAGYKTETIKMVLEPGQEYSFSVSGPSMTYVGQKFYDLGTYKAIQKQDIQLLWVSNVDLIGSHLAAEGAAGNYGYVADASMDNPAQERCIVESTYHCSLSMPEKVGGISTAVASIFQNANRVKRTCIDEWGATTFAAEGHRRDEENPVQETS